MKRLPLVGQCTCLKDKDMNNKLNYPTWLVPLDIAQELKEIGFDEPTLFHYYENDFDVTIETNSYYDEGEAQGYLHFYISAFKEENFNRDKKCVSLPVWEQALAWFRAKGYKITFKDINIGTQCAFYHLDIKEGHTFSYFAKKYEKAREGLVMKLIEVHKEFGNKIKRFD